MVGISIWDSAEACDHYRRSDVEARSPEAMGPFVIESGRASTPVASWESRAADPGPRHAPTSRIGGTVGGGRCWVCPDSPVLGGDWLLVGIGHRRLGRLGLGLFLWRHLRVDGRRLRHLDPAYKDGSRPLDVRLRTTHLRVGSRAGLGNHAGGEPCQAEQAGRVLDGEAGAPAGRLEGVVQAAGLSRYPSVGRRRGRPVDVGARAASGRAA